jgi:hypothetical protein
MINPLLPNFSAALEAGLPDAALNSSDMIEQYNETDSPQFVNAAGKNKGLLGGLIGAAAGVGGALLVTDLVNKNNKKKEQKRKAEEEQRQKAEAEANALKEQQAAAELAAAQTPPASPKKSNTMLYVGVGVGALVLFVGVIALARR